MNKNQRGFGAVGVLLIVLCLTMISGAVCYVWKSQPSKNPTEAVINLPQNNNETNPPISSEQFDSSKTAKILDFDKASESFKKALIDEYYYVGESLCEGWTSTAPNDIWGRYYLAVTDMVRDDFAGVHFCSSGATSVFAHLGERWEQVTSLADTPMCETVDKYKISREITPVCALPDSSERLVDYP